MSFDDSNVESLRERLRAIEAQLADRNNHVARLERAIKEMEQKVKEASETQQPASEISEMEETLKRMVMRVAMILQASKCMFMIYDADNRELFAETPALGFEDEQVKGFRVSVDGTLSGECFRENKPVILYDAETDERAMAEGLAGIGVKNGLCVPLIVERRDEETAKLIDRKTIGVLHVFNKRYGNIFIEDDVQLLERMAKNTAAIINMAESYRQVVKERDEAIETIQSLSMGLLMVNKGGRITQMNNSALRIFGLKKDELHGGKTFDQVIKDEKVIDLLKRALSTDGEVADELTLSDPDSPEQVHTFQIQSAGVRTDTGEVIGTAAIFNDITEIKNVDKMKTAFVSTVSHELRTPLTSIKGFISTLLQDTEGFYDNETRHEFYTIIDTECDRLRRLIDDLLNVSRIESGKVLELNVADVDLRKVTEKAMRIQDSSTYKRENHSLAYEIDPEVPATIEADQDKIEQILANLVSNALKYSPKGGEVKVSARMMGPEMVQFGISDQGMGIPKEHLTKMGERFHRVDNRDTREIGGTGIGLFLVKNLVEFHHGKLWVESEVGKGSTFFFTLPTTQPEDTGEGGSLASRVAG
ncbi:MAG TPA: ATP-binding protein [Armatimonadaceae bacterium]|nr:ATP-binding protein [Armatimonadaceae bacterium]